MHPVEQEFVMQVGSGGVTGGAYLADNLSLAHFLATRDLLFMQVKVFGYE